MPKRLISRADVMAPEAYAAVRAERRAKVVEIKKRRRLEVGPVATWYFESYETMWLQVHEMLHIEKGGPGQIEDELRAYNPLIPNGHELIATIMFEIDEPARRATFLGKLGGIEETAFLQFAGHRVVGRPEADLDRTSAEGKASSVQFVHFPFTAEEIAAFRSPGQQVIAGFSHPAYGHMAVMPEAIRATLAADFDEPA
jgi:uncharacterized protein DUF3501